MKLALRIGLLVSLILGIWVGPPLMPSTPTVAFTNPTADSEVLLNNFEGFDLWLWEPQDVVVQETTEHCTEGRGCAKVSFSSGENIWPGIELSAANMNQTDWTSFFALAVDVYNPQEDYLLIDSRYMDGDGSCLWRQILLTSGMSHIEILFSDLTFWEPLKKIQGQFIREEGDVFDLHHIESLKFYFDPPVPIIYEGAPQPNGPTLYFDNLRLIPYEVSAPTNNLVENSSYETTPYDGWQGTLMLAGRAFFGNFQPELDSSTGFDGETSIKLTYPLTAEVQNALKIPNPPPKFYGNIVGVSSRGIQIEAGKQYTLSLYLKGESPGIRVKFYVSGTSICFENLVEVSTGWKRYWVAGTIKEENLFNNAVSVKVELPDVIDKAVWVDAVQLEEGELTDYQPTKSLELGLSTEKAGNLFEIGEPIVITLHFTTMD